MPGFLGGESSYPIVRLVQKWIDRARKDWTIGDALEDFAGKMSCFERGEMA
jgi:hypothetical protein